MANGFGDELKRRLPELVLGILAAKQGGPQALGAFQGGVQDARQVQQVQQRQAMLDEERRQQQAAQEARAASAEQRAEDAARQQRLTQALSVFDRYAGGVAETATDPVAAENAVLSRGTGLETAFGLPQGQLSAFVPNMAPPISKRLQTVAKQTYEQAEKLYGPEAMASDSITLTTEAFGPVKPSELRAKFAPQATLAGGEAAPILTAKPDVPNTPEEQFYQQFARENGAARFDQLPTKAQAAARKQWMQADDRPITVNTGAQDQRRFSMEQRLVAQWDKAQTPVRDMRRALTIMDVGLKRFKEGDKNGGSQDILVTFQKILDPTSVVRESEYARSSHGISMLGRIEGYADRLKAGGAGVPERELAMMVQTAREMYQALETFNAGLRERIGRTATEYQLDPRMIFDDVGAPPVVPPGAPQPEWFLPPEGAAPGGKQRIGRFEVETTP